MTLPDPGARAGHEDVFPCGCRIESEWGHIHPCEIHEVVTNEQTLLEVLKNRFPDDPSDVPEPERIPEVPFGEMDVVGGDEPEQRMT